MLERTIKSFTISSSLSTKISLGCTLAALNTTQVTLPHSPTSFNTALNFALSAISTLQVFTSTFLPADSKTEDSMLDFSEERRVLSRERMAILENLWVAKDLLIDRPRPGPEPIRRSVGVADISGEGLRFGLMLEER